MMKSLFLCACLCGVVLYAEPSVYGSSSSVDVAYKKTIASLKRELARQKERIDGLTSIVEGLSLQINTLKQTKRSLLQESNPNNAKLLKELGMMIDEINNNYVSKEELANVLKSNKQSTNIDTKSSKTKKDSSSLPLVSQAAAKLYSEGVRLFMKKRYDEAKKRFLLIDEKGYKPAASNYYLGEIAYYTKKYEDAIFYFKKSAGLYDKASYIDVLLLHTAISLEKTGQKSQARAFYENIIENYADKKSASIARKKLEKL